jgi:hypothetical protein
MMSEPEPKSTALVPIEKSTIENAAAASGAVVGLFLAGPLGSLVLAALASYVSKKDNDAGDALRGFGKTVIESFNYFTKLNSKYDFSGSVSKVISEATAKIEATENEQIKTIQKTYKETVEKISELNSEYDLVGKGLSALDVAKGLSDAALEKVDELNSKVKNNRVSH